MSFKHNLHCSSHCALYIRKITASQTQLTLFIILCPLYMTSNNLVELTFLLFIYKSHRGINNIKIKCNTYLKFKIKPSIQISQLKCKTNESVLT